MIPSWVFREERVNNFKDGKARIKSFCVRKSIIDVWGRDVCEGSNTPSNNIVEETIEKPFSPEYFLERRNGWWIVDKNKQGILEIPHREYVMPHSHFSKENLALVVFREDGFIYYNFVNLSGNMLFSKGAVHHAGSFTEGLAYVDRYKTDSATFEREKGYINSNGKFVIKLSDDIKEGFKFSNGLARVVFDEWGEGYIDKEGLYLVDPSNKQNYIDAIKEDYRYINRVPVDVFEEIKEEILDAVKFSIKSYIDEHVNDETLKEDVADKLKDANARFGVKDVQLAKIQAAKKAEEAARKAEEARKAAVEAKRLETYNIVDTFTFGGNEGKGKE